MRKFFAVPFVVLWALFFLTSSAEPAARRTTYDHPFFPRPSGYTVSAYSSGEGVLRFPSPSNAGYQTFSLSGQLTEVLYRRAAGRPLTSTALGQRFLASLRKYGGEVIYQENPSLGGRRAVGKFVRRGRDVWVMQEILSLREYRVSVLEVPNGRWSVPSSLISGDFELEAQVLDLLHTLDRTGRLEFPLRFAPGSSVPQKGYEMNFRKFVMLMDKDPSLKFRVSAYTDPKLKPSEQRTLLRSRLEAIVRALDIMGADKGRLTTEVPPEETSTDAPSGFVRLTSVSSVEPAAQ